MSISGRFGAASLHIVPLVYGLCVAIVIATVVAIVDMRETKNARRMEIASQLESTTTKLEEAVQERLQLVRGLVAFVQSRKTFNDEEFLAFAQALEARQAGVLSLQLAPNGVIKYLTQPETNESARGLDLLANPQRFYMVQRSITRREYVITGPRALVQGGTAIVGRWPIFKPNASGDSDFWGFAIILLDLGPLLADAGIGTVDRGLDYALRGRDGRGADGDVFFGEESIFANADAVHLVALPTGSWQIAAVANENWAVHWSGRKWLWWVGLSLAALAGTMIWALVRRPRELRRLIEEATHALRVSQERYKTLATVAPVGIFQISGGTQLMFANEVWSEITGLTGPGYDSLVYRRMIHPEDVDLVAGTWERLKQDQVPFKIEYRFTKPGGKEIWLLETAMHQPTEDAQDNLIVGSIVDITARKNAEAELAASNAELEQFAAIASHDLKAPLRAVKGYCALLQEEYADKLDEPARDYISSAIEGAVRMRNLIDDLLEFSRAGFRARTIEMVESADVLDTVLADLRFDIEDSGASIVARNLPALLADRHDLGQVFQNLVGNGLEYCGDAEPRIVVEGEAAGDFWLICVADSGIGVAPEQADAVFEVFARLHSRSDHPGSGMGLAICRKIIERNGGRIWLDSGYSDGARFCFTWPRDTQTPD